MPSRIVWDIFVTPPNGPQFIANAFFQTAERTRHMEKPVRDITQQISNELATNFASEGRPAKWEGLAIATIRKRGSAHPILDDTGALREAASSPESWDIAASGQTIVADLATPGYGRFHLTGTRFMPQRDWSFIPPEIDGFIDEKMDEWILSPLEAV